MSNCPCIESFKKFLATGKWEGESCLCGRNLPLGHLAIAAAAGFLLVVVIRALFPRR